MEDRLLKNYFGAQQKILKALGVSLTQTLSVKQKCYFYLLYAVMATYLLLVIPELFLQECFDDLVNDLIFCTGYVIVIYLLLYEQIVNSDNPNFKKISMICNFFISCVYWVAYNIKLLQFSHKQFYFLVLVKISALFFNRAKLENILSTFELFSNMYCKSKTEKNWIKRSISVAVVQTVLGILGGFVILISCTVISYTKTDKELPFGSVLITRYYRYELVLIYQIIIFGFLFLISVVSDVFFASILAQLCIQCKTTQNTIKAMIQVSMDNAKNDKHIVNVASDIPWMYLQKSIKSVVVHHRCIIKLAEDIEDMSNKPVLVVFIGLSIGFCLILYQISMSPLLDSSFFKSVTILLAATTSLFLNTYYGSQLIHESITIADSCYEVDFVGTDVRFQKALRFILQRSQKPIKITIGKFDTVSVALIVGMFRFAYSSLTLLHKVNDTWEKRK